MLLLLKLPPLHSHEKVCERVLTEFPDRLPLLRGYVPTGPCYSDGVFTPFTWCLSPRSCSTSPAAPATCRRTVRTPTISPRVHARSTCVHGPPSHPNPPPCIPCPRTVRAWLPPPLLPRPRPRPALGWMGGGGAPPAWRREGASPCPSSSCVSSMRCLGRRSVACGPVAGRQTVGTTAYVCTSFKPNIPRQGG